MISLKGNLDYVEHLYYNDHIKVEDTDLHYTSGKSLPTTPTTCTGASSPSWRGCERDTVRGEDRPYRAAITYVIIW